MPDSRNQISYCRPVEWEGRSLRERLSEPGASLIDTVREWLLTRLECLNPAMKPGIDHPSEVSGDAESRRKRHRTAEYH